MINNSQVKSNGVTANGKAEQNYLHYRQGKDEQHHPVTIVQNHRQDTTFIKRVLHNYHAR
jgi:hypothetical protein